MVLADLVSNPGQALAALGFAALAGGALLALALFALRGSRVRARTRHDVLLAILAGLVALPLVAQATGVGVDPMEPLAVADAEQAVFTRNAAGKFPDLQRAQLDPDAGAVPVAPSSSAASIILALWACGAALVAARTIRRLVAALRFARGCVDVDAPWRRALERARRESGLRGAVRIVAHPSAETPMVWGPPWAFVVIPLAMARRPIAPGDRLTLLHELAHLDRRDSLAKLGADLVAAIFWFHPLVWLARGRLERDQEIACDDRVLERGVAPSVYSAHLVSLFRSSRTAAALGLSSIAGGGAFSERIVAILDPHRRPEVRHVERRAPRRFGALGLAAGFAAAAIVVVARGQGAGAARELSAARLHAELNPVVVNGLAEHRIAGAAVAVVHDGETVYQRGFGNAEVFGPRTVDPERTIFRIGSVSKVVTGIAVMQCVDRGLLDLDADVNDYLEEFEVEPTFEEPVRVRHLLTHTAGFDQLGYGRHVLTADEVLPLGEFLPDNLVRVRPPGQVSCYDTYAITLAGHLVELVSGLTYEEYLKRHIFEPLGMQRSCINVPDELRADVAVGYEFGGSWVPQRWEFMNTDPASTVNSTVADMARLAAMFLEGGSYAGKRILSQESVDAMLTQQFTNHPDQPGYGLTLFEDWSHGVHAFSHGGSMTGFGCFLYLLPSERTGLFVAYNQESGALGSEVIERTVSLLGAGAAPQPLRPRAPRVDAWRFEGLYADNSYNHSRPERGGWPARPFEIVADDHGNLDFRGRSCQPVGERTFQSADGLLLTFLPAEGAVEHLVVGQTVYERL